MALVNEQQKRAIEENGKNILVSAGAGSGKTRVLTERVFMRISSDKYNWNINDMLVLTFTNAAAANMKERIRNKIKNNEDGSLSIERQKEQLNKIDNSFIMTFDAYAQFLIKKYHILLGLDKDIKIIDQNVLNNKTQELLNDIILEEYKNNDNKFINLINDFCFKDDYDLRETIIEVNNKLNSIYNRKQYINDYENNHYSDASINNDINEYTNLLLTKIKTIDILLNDLSSYVEDYKEYFIGIDNLLHATTYKQIKESYNIDHSKQMRGKGEEAKQIKSEIVDLLKEINELCLFDEDEIKKQINNTKENTLQILELAERLNNQINEFKKQNNTYEFSDVFKMAIDLVESNNEVRDEIKYGFKEILIDEYQDTNDLQDKFISLIENNNVYVVGDIKQSIYKFRNANPNLFIEKYNNYQNSDNGMVLSLSANYRSRSEVLEGIDDIFSRIMDTQIGGADYAKSHKMSADNGDYLDENKAKIANQDNKFEVLSYPTETDSPEGYPFNELSLPEIEAFIIAKDIKEKVESGFKVAYKAKEIDQNGKEYEVTKTRPVNYSDFTILVDRGTHFDLFKQILTSCNIPSDIKTEEKMDESDLIVVVRALFKLICCIVDKDFDYEFKYSYLSLARSFIIEALDSSLHDVVTTNAYSSTELYKKVEKIAQNIETKTINDILDEFINDFDVYDNLTKIGDVHENIVKINYLYQLGNTLSESGYNYKDFNDYLINIFDYGDEQTIKFKINKDNVDAVTITNIHQSKGLEYPICYYPLLTISFNDSDIRDNFVFNNQRGLIIPTMIEARGLKQTIRKELFKKDYKIENLSEKIRLFYVALTRAKEKAIIVCPLQNNTKDGEIINDEIRLGIRCYKDLLEMVYDDISKYIKEVNFEDYKDTINSDYQLLVKDIFSAIPKTNKQIKLKKPINIDPEEVDNSGFSKKAGLISKDTIEKMKLGSDIHYCLEVIDLKNPNYDNISSEYKLLIEAFINSDIMKNVGSGKVYKEYEFIYDEDNNRKHGFIDLMIEYNDHIDIIDYKTKNIDDENYDKQLNGYRKYIQSISNKNVNCYLYSITNKTYREVK